MSDAVDYSAATSVDRTELLEIQNLSLRARVLELERHSLSDALIRKYGVPGQELTVRDDGTIQRPGT